MDTSIQQLDFFSLEAKNPTESLHNGYLLHDRYTPATILKPKPEAPRGKIWCNHCGIYLVIGAESVSHQNLVRKSQCCMTCAGWNWEDEGIPVEHATLCTDRDDSRVWHTYGGSQHRATKLPARNASQTEAAAWPHV